MEVFGQEPPGVLGSQNKPSDPRELFYLQFQRNIHAPCTRNIAGETVEQTALNFNELLGSR